MSSQPEDIIAITIKRYLNPPNDEKFWRDYTKLKHKSPENVLHLINQFTALEELRNRLMQKNDDMLFFYMKTLDGKPKFPRNYLIKQYEKKYFTPDDDDFYNRVIYENEIEKLKEENEKLKQEAQEAIEAKKSFISRDFVNIRVLGSGGFGTVFLLKHKLSDQFFAGKRLNSLSKENQKIIQQEIKTVASFSHPNIIGYKNGFNIGSILYLIMDYCPNGSLDEKIRKNGKLNEDELINTFITLTNTFEFLHKKNIIHHDIKPSNILFDENNTIKISDFGCVNSTMGTPAYLPPEAFESHSYSPNNQSDIYALGITLLESALGYNPFFGKTVDEQVEIIKTANLPIDLLPYWLQNIILKAVHYDSSSRYTSMQEFHDSLIKRNIPHFLNSEIIALEKDAKRLSYFVKRKKWRKADLLIKTHTNLFKNLNLVVNAGIFYLNTHKITEAQKCFERALKLNPQTNVEKQIAEVYLQNGNAAKAASILTGYINRNFSDIESHNQLLFSYFLSGRWKLGLEQAQLLVQAFPGEAIFINNQAVFCFLLNKSYLADDLKLDHSFGDYNYSVYSKNSPEAWYRNNHPLIQNKLLFQEYKFRNIENSKNTLEISIADKKYKVSNSLISFGRKGYDYNIFSQFDSNSVSRRHFAIVNMKNNVWLYDLDSTGVYVDGQKVNQKCFLLGFHKIKFGDYEIEVKTDEQILL